MNSLYTLSKSQKQALIIAIGVSLLAQVLPLVKLVSQIYSTVFHELGHALAAWLFGYIALPKLDFINGGGVTHLLSRPFLLCCIAIIFVVINLLILKDQLKNKKWFLILLISYLLFFFTPLHSFIITFMGKGGELLFFYLVAWYSLSRQLLSLRFKEMFYLVLAVFLWVNSVLDSLSLIYNKADRLNYIAGKQQLLGGDPLVNDLVKLNQASGLSFDFFNWLLLILAFFSMHKLLKVVDKSILDKQRIRDYGILLLNTSKAEFNKVKALTNQSKK